MLYFFRRLAGRYSLVVNFNGHPAGAEYCFARGPRRVFNDLNQFKPSFSHVCLSPRIGYLP
jgi:hypothetical protein